MDEKPKDNIRPALAILATIGALTLLTSAPAIIIMVWKVALGL